jgi:triacylglycerol esterase/lipase EstA (alpha/beta hydrolase family)
MDYERLRHWQFRQIGYHWHTITAIMSYATSIDLTAYRDGGDGWTVLEVMCHLSDYEEVFINNARVTVEGSNETLVYPRPHDLEEQNNYAAQQPDEVLSTWEARRERFVGYVKACSEDDWHKTGVHPRFGDFSLHDQLFLYVHHNAQHIEQITRILAEKQTGT